MAPAGTELITVEAISFLLRIRHRWDKLVTCRSLFGLFFPVRMKSSLFLSVRSSSCLGHTGKLQFRAETLPGVILVPRLRINNQRIFKIISKTERSKHGALHRRLMYFTPLGHARRRRSRRKWKCLEEMRQRWWHFLSCSVTWRPPPGHFLFSTSKSVFGLNIAIAPAFIRPEPQTRTSDLRGASLLFTKSPRPSSPLLLCSALFDYSINRGNFL